jgi:hypothetical protein
MIGSLENVAALALLFSQAAESARNALSNPDCFNQNRLYQSGTSPEGTNLR